MSDFDKELDTSGLNCPLPIIKAKKEINGMDSGQTLKIISTDPGLSTEEKDNKFYFLLKKN